MSQNTKHVVDEVQIRFYGPEQQREKSRSKKVSVKLENWRSLRPNENKKEKVKLNFSHCLYEKLSILQCGKKVFFKADKQKNDTRNCVRVRSCECV